MALSVSLRCSLLLLCDAGVSWAALVRCAGGGKCGERLAAVAQPAWRALLTVDGAACHVELGRSQLLVHHSSASTPIHPTWRMSI